MRESAGCLYAVVGIVALFGAMFAFEGYRMNNWETYHVATVYCPGAPPLVLDSVSTFWRETSRVHIEGRGPANRAESPSCTVRWGKP